MNLYNLYNDVILEEVELINRLLTESVYTNDVIDAINGKYNVNIQYKDYEDQPPSKRYIQVYNFAKTKAGNDAIRAYQIFGGSKTTPRTGSWKMFRLDKIVGWIPTQVRWKRPVSDLDATIPKYNDVGDRSMAQVYNKVTI